MREYLSRYALMLKCLLFTGQVEYVGPQPGSAMAPGEPNLTTGTLERVHLFRLNIPERDREPKKREMGRDSSAAISSADYCKSRGGHWRLRMDG